MTSLPLPSPPDLALERHRLDNGLRVVLHRDDALPLVALNLWYHTGSKNERPGKTGFAHLFEHMLFQGSEHVDRNGHFRYVQSVGGVANGSTWFDRTNYFETLPSNSLELGLWLESDRMGYLLPAMTEEKLETQRQVVMNERRQSVDNRPYGRANEMLAELLYPASHPYSWPVIGYMDDIAAATLADVREFFRTYYTPANAVLTLAGDFEPGAALAAVDRYFGELPRAEPPTSASAAAGGTRGDRRGELADDVQLARIYHAYRTPPYGSRTWYAGDLLARVMSHGKASRLYRDLVYERELAQSVQAYMLPTEEEGSFHLVATCRPGVSIDELERALADHLAAMRSDPPRDDELERARNGLLTAELRALQSLERRADLLSMFTTYFDRPEDATREIAIYADIAPAELVTFARTHLRSDDRARLHVVPRAGR